ncbi:MAG: substrate-binding domain-containing protein [Candidatus Hydrogenedentales bacterium]
MSDSSFQRFRKLQQASILLLLVVLCLFASFQSPTFFRWSNLVDNLLTNASAIGVIAVGMTFVMIAGGFDLSVASITAVCSVVLVLVMDALSAHGAAVAITGALSATALTGMLLGAINGALIAYVGVNPFVVTLSTMLVFRGLALILTGGGQAMQVGDLALRARFNWIYDARVPLFGPDYQVSMPIVIFIVVFAAGVYLLKFTRFGHYTYAIGGNEEATRLSGVNTALLKAASYVLVGLTCAVAAAIFVAMTQTAQAESHQGKELDVIASVIVGGTPLGGGSGGLSATLTGVLLLRVIDNLLTQFSVGAEYRQVVTGLIILIVVAVDVLAKRRSARRRGGKAGKIVKVLAALVVIAVCAVVAVVHLGPKERTYQIAFLMTLDHPYWQNMRLGAQDEAKKLGAEITILNAKEDPVLQIQQIQEVIAKRVDAVCLVPMKTEPLVRGVQLLNRAGLPVIIVNREIGEGCDYVCYTGTDSYLGAVVSAQILAKAIGGKGEIVEFHQHLGTGPEIARSKALRDVLKDYPGITIVERIPHKGERDVVKTEMQTLLDKYPNLAGIYAHGDDFAIAASQVCSKAGRNDIKSVGMGGSEEAVNAVREGVITGTSYQQPEEEGRSAVRLAIQYLKGEKLEKSYPVLCPPITKENASQYKGQF